eukprot:2694671-Prymnesium_polylepis.1
MDGSSFSTIGPSNPPTNKTSSRSPWEILRTRLRASAGTGMRPRSRPVMGWCAQIVHSDSYYV